MQGNARVGDALDLVVDQEETVGEGLALEAGDDVAVVDQEPHALGQDHGLDQILVQGGEGLLHRGDLSVMVDDPEVSVRKKRGAEESLGRARAQNEKSDS